MILGAGEFNFFQKILIKPERDYQLTITARFKSLLDILVIGVCKKHILTSEHNQPKGWLGLVLFLCLIIFAVKHQCVLLKKGHSIPLAFLPSIAAILLEGLTGTMVDAPRISTQIYLILFAALQWPDENAFKKTAKANILTFRQSLSKP